MAFPSPTEHASKEGALRGGRVQANAAAGVSRGGETRAQLAMSLWLKRAHATPRNTAVYPRKGSSLRIMVSQ